MRYRVLLLALPLLVTGCRSEPDYRIPMDRPLTDDDVYEYDRRSGRDASDLTDPIQRPGVIRPRPIPDRPDPGAGDRVRNRDNRQTPD